jgi:LAO/AO transport system kinase
MNLAKAILEGDQLALARLLTRVENDDPRGREALDKLFPHTGKAHLVGITGSPGTGKSSLANQLAKIFRKPPDGSPKTTVAIVAVDPTSPFTGGAILGDRVRMKDLHGDSGIFIRSMASRGALGGIARTTAAMVQVLDAAGFDVIMVETVGAGQAEVDIASLAHTTIVVEVPGLGDDIQAIKAGILEIADILVINKADRPGIENAEKALKSMLVVNKADLPGVENAERALRSSLELAHPSSRENGKEPWQIPVIKTQSLQGEGAETVVKTIREHGAFLKRNGDWEIRDLHRLKSELEKLIEQRLVTQWRTGVSDAAFTRILDAIQKRQISPYQAVEELVK